MIFFQKSGSVVQVDHQAAEHPPPTQKPLFPSKMATFYGRFVIPREFDPKIKKKVPNTVRTSEIRNF